MSTRISYLTGSVNESNAIHKLLKHVSDSATMSDSSLEYLWHIKTIPFVAVVDCPVNAANLRQSPFSPPYLIPLMHSIENERMAQYQRKQLEKAKPDHVIVTSGEDIAELLRTWGFEATYIPISIDASKFPHQPYPKEFTIGYLGARMDHKRFDVVDKAGKDAGVNVFGSTRDSHVGGNFEGKEQEFYKQISCYVSATTCEHAPFPTLEALLSGRPLVIPTAVSSPPELLEAVEQGAGIVADDADRVDAIKEVRDNFEEYARRARQFKMKDTSGDYERVILEVCS